MSHKLNIQMRTDRQAGWTRVARSYLDGAIFVVSSAA